MSIKKIALIVLGVSVISAVMILIIMQTRINNTGVPVDIIIVPEDSRVKVGDTYIDSDKIHLRPGTYSYTVEKDGFKTFTDVIVIEDSLDRQIISGRLLPVSDEAKKWYEDNKQKYLNVERVYGEQAIERGMELREDNPIISELPYRSVLFTIGYKADTKNTNPNAIIVTISAQDVYRESAVQQIRNWGYNPAELNIEFINEENPFDAQ